jgi:flotillin
MQVPPWGRVVAKPHEFLIHMRRGRVVTSGQGTSCFRWPSDAVALVATSVAKLSFVADQVTREKVGVEVTGLAVYRVAEPLLAFRMLDGEASRLTDILRDMFVGATRRIVASLSLDECITHRKERVARALLEEIAPVLAGRGALGDSSDQGWGVVIDTLEIQNVRVLSEEVFKRLQAPYREALALDALKARELVEQEQVRIDLERKRAEEQSRRLVLEAEEARLVQERRRALANAEHQGQVARTSLGAELARNEERARAEEARRSRDLEEELVRAQRLADAERARSLLELSTQREREVLELTSQRERGELEVELAQKRREQRADLTDAQLQEVLLTETMPRLAEAFRGSFETIHLTTAQGEGSPLFGFLASGIEQVLRTARRSSAGPLYPDRTEGTAAAEAGRRPAG